MVKKPWSSSQERAFERWLAIYTEEEPDRWIKIAAEIPDFSPAEIEEHYEALQLDIEGIEYGPIESLDHTAEDSDEEQVMVMEEGTSSEKIIERTIPNRSDQKRVLWTGEEHIKFLEGLTKYGKGQWKAISKYLLPSKTPTQIASHAQKYFLRLKNMPKRRKRASIHDLTLEEDIRLAPQQNPVPPMQPSPPQQHKVPPFIPRQQSSPQQNKDSPLDVPQQVPIQNRVVPLNVPQQVPTQNRIVPLNVSQQVPTQNRVVPLNVSQQSFSQQNRGSSWNGPHPLHIHQNLVLPCNVPQQSYTQQNIVLPWNVAQQSSFQQNGVFPMNGPWTLPDQQNGVLPMNFAQQLHLHENWVPTSNVVRQQSQETPQVQEGFQPNLCQCVCCRPNGPLMNSDGRPSSSFPNTDGPSDGGLMPFP